MKIFKEFVLDQKDKKRMGRWIKFFLIAGKLVGGGKRVTLNLSENWAHSKWVS